MRYIQSVFLKGLFTLLPLAVTVYLVIALARGLESVFGPLIGRVLRDGIYVPGMGVVLGLLFIFAVGLLMQVWVMRWIWKWGESYLDRMPVIRQVYGAIKQVVSYVSGDEQPRASRVVMLNVGDPPLRMLGLVTRMDVAYASEESPADMVAVFLPWSYQVGGFTVYVPRSALEPVDLRPEEALRLSLTAAMYKESEPEVAIEEPHRG
jgi:uncharacterized membrane protein